jgi:hydrogenase expression/formation protein HypC
MCLAIPAKIIEINNGVAAIELGGVTRQASLILLPSASLGDYVLVHAGFAISLVDEREAAKTLSLFAELSAAIDDAENNEPGFPKF